MKDEHIPQSKADVILLFRRYHTVLGFESFLRSRRLDPRLYSNKI